MRLPALTCRTNVHLTFSLLRLSAPIVLHGTDPQQHTQEGIHRRDGAHDLLAVGEAPDARESKVQRAGRRQEILRDPLENIISLNQTEDDKKTKKPHITFTADEMNILWNNLNVPYVDAIILQCYSGWRPQELCRLEIENIDLDNMVMTGGMKTESGKKRTVPIHSKIQPIVRTMYEKAVTNGSKYLLSNENGTDGIDYNRYQYVFSDIRNRLGLNPDHRPHDPRVFFVTEAKNGNADEYAIKRMIGHRISDITEKVYAKRSIEWLREEIEKIK